MSFAPYPHQERVANLMLSGKNIILQAPTGAGKTRAAMMPFLESFHPDSGAGGALPPKCIYSVPMRVLAKQFHHEFDKTVKEYSLKIARDISVAIQTGDEQRDRQFASNLIFATIDQTLSSFLISPYSLSKRQANLNAGAVMSSYLVFDEFHLFDPQSTLPTTLHMLKMLKGITPFLLMTATFSQTMLDELAEELDAVVVGTSPAEREEFATLASQDKELFYHTADDVMSAEFILEKHTGRTLVICNQIARARRMYEQISAGAKPETEVLLLHSHFLPDDRQKIEDRIRDIFGKENRHGNDDCIVISTQAIEVGVDMTSTFLHTELAPANSIVQRAGRCARYQGDEGHVYIYRHVLNTDDEVIDLIENTLPYSNTGEVISKTWEAFYECDGRQFSYEDEQEALNFAHAEQDARIIRELKEQEVNHRKLIYSTMRGQEDARNLIRNIIAQPVTVHDNPAEVAKDPFAYPSFSLHPGTLQKHLQQWFDNPAYQHSHQISMIRLNENEDDAQANIDRYIAEPVLDASQAWMAPLLIVHPDLATYDSTTGFLPESDGQWVAEIDTESDDDDNPRGFSYRLETYEEHIAHVYDAFERFWTESEWAADKLEKRFEWQPGSIEKAARLAVLLHDVGKLSKKWQKWVHNYQQKLVDADLLDDSHLSQEGQAYAHTDFSYKDERYRDIQKQSGKRPWHAVEGAYSVWDILLNELQDNEALTRAVYTAIARHHTAQSSEHQSYQLEASAGKHIEATFKNRLRFPDLDSLYGVDEKVEPFDSDAHDLIINEHEPEQILTYMLLVRALRRADSKGTALGTLTS